MSSGVVPIKRPIESKFDLNLKNKKASEPMISAADQSKLQYVDANRIGRSEVLNDQQEHVS